MIAPIIVHMDRYLFLLIVFIMLVKKSLKPYIIAPNNAPGIQFSDNDKFVFRLPRKNANSIINRINEKNNQILSFKSGFNVQTIYFNEKSGIKITKFLEEAKTLNPQTVREHIEEIGKDIKNIHSSNMPFRNHFDAFKEMDKYLFLLSSEYRNHKFLKDGLILFEKLKNKLIEINMDLYNKSFIYTPTHGDIVPENILAIKNPLKIFSYQRLV